MTSHTPYIDKSMRFVDSLDVGFSHAQSVVS